MVGGLVGLAAGAAYFAFITDMGTSVLWPPIAATVILLALAGAVAGAAGDRIRARALVRETMLAQAAAERQRLNDELRESYDQQRSIVERLERAFLDVPANLEYIDSGHEYHSATKGVHVGGDFYDLITASSTSVAVLMGDVSGHGLDAARVATMVKDVVSVLVLQQQAPGHILGVVNDLLLRKGVSGFVTVFLAQLDTRSGEMVFASAGHPPPFVTDEHDRVRQLVVVPGPPLGVFPSAKYPAGQGSLKSSGLLFLYTDGLTEARGAGAFYGEERLTGALEKYKGLSARDLPGLVVADVLEFTDGSLQDDMALLALRYRPEGPPGVVTSVGAAQPLA